MTIARIIIVLAILGVAAWGYFLYKKSKKKVVEDEPVDPGKSSEDSSIKEESKQKGKKK